MLLLKSVKEGKEVCVNCPAQPSWCAALLAGEGIRAGGRLGGLGSYQRFREGVGVVGGQELPDLPPLSLPVEPAGFPQVLSVLLAGASLEGVGAAALAVRGAGLRLRGRASLGRGGSRARLGPLAPPQGRLRGLRGGRGGRGGLAGPGVRRRGPPVFPAALPRSLRPGPVRLSFGRFGRAAQAQVGLGPGRRPPGRPAAALDVRSAADTRHRSGRGLSPPRDLRAAVQLRGAPLPPRPVRGQVPLGQGTGPRSEGAAFKNVTIGTCHSWVFGSTF